MSSGGPWVIARTVVLFLASVVAACGPVGGSAVPASNDQPAAVVTGAAVGDAHLGPCAPTFAHMVPPQEVADFMMRGSSRYNATAEAWNARPSLESWAASENWVGNEGIWVSLPTNGLVSWGSTTSTSKFWTYVVGRVGAVTATARRLDGPAVSGFSMSGGTPSEGYGPPGFIPAGFLFPADGCWEVTYRVGDGSVTFVVEVLRK